VNHFRNRFRLPSGQAGQTSGSSRRVLAEASPVAGKLARRFFAGTSLKTPLKAGGSLAAGP